MKTHSHRFTIRTTYAHVATNIKGRRFGRLTVVERHPENAKNGVSRWRCLCECGREVIIRSDSLTRGSSSSCGCNNQVQTPTKSPTAGQPIWADELFPIENYPQTTTGAEDFDEGDFPTDEELAEQFQQLPREEQLQIEAVYRELVRAVQQLSTDNNTPETMVRVKPDAKTFDATAAIEAIADQDDYSHGCGGIDPPVEPSPETNSGPFSVEWQREMLDLLEADSKRQRPPKYWEADFQRWRKEQSIQRTLDMKPDSIGSPVVYVHPNQTQQIEIINE